MLRRMGMSRGTPFVAAPSLPDLPAEFTTNNILVGGTDLSDVAWTKVGSAIVADAVASPYSTDADQIVEDTNSSAHDVRQTVAFTSGTTYQMEAIVASVGGRNVFLQLPSAAFGVNQVARYDLSAVTATQQTGSSLPTIADLGGGWYRVSQVVAATATASANIIIRALDGINGIYLGDGSSGLYVVAATVYEVV